MGVKKFFCDFVFPQTCVHCGQLFVDHPLCEACSGQFEWLGEKEAFGNLGFPLSSAASTFSYEGPIQSLICAYKYDKRHFLAKGLASLMAVQWSELEQRTNMPAPSLVVPMPTSRLKLWDRGFNPAGLLAKEFAALLNVPYCSILGRKCGDISQAGLSQKERAELSNASFYIRKNQTALDQTLLLIDDVWTTGTTLKRAAETLLGAYPKNIYAFTLARTPS